MSNHSNKYYAIVFYGASLRYNVKQLYYCSGFANPRFEGQHYREESLYLAVKGGTPIIKKTILSWLGRNRHTSKIAAYLVLYR